MPSPLLSLRTNSTSAGCVEGKLYLCGGFHGPGTKMSPTVFNSAVKITFTGHSDQPHQVALACPGATDLILHFELPAPNVNMNWVLFDFCIFP